MITDGAERMGSIAVFIAILIAAIGIDRISGAVGLRPAVMLKAYRRDKHIA